MSDQYVGEIRMFAGNFAPQGWAFCDGQLLSIAENDVLFALIGTTYGGDGQSTFALPDLRGRIPIHQGAQGGSTYPLGQQGGQETVTLTAAQLPAHTHLVGASQSAAGEAGPRDHVLARTSGFDPYVRRDPGTPMDPAAVSATGGGQPHDNVQPFLCVSFIIALVGIFPSQT